MAVFSGNGSNTSPSFTFSSDTNTGIYRYGADAVSIATNGAERFRVENDRVFISGGAGYSIALRAASITDTSINVTHQTASLGTALNFSNPFAGESSGHGSRIAVSSGGAFSYIDGVRDPDSNGAATRLNFSNANPSNVNDVRMSLTSTYLRLSNNGGIQFNGDTAAANALNDYDEGNFTPGFAFDSGTATITYDSLRQGRYVKVGKLVTCNIRIRTDAFAVDTASGRLQITGLPFAGDGATFIGAFGSAVISLSNNAAGNLVAFKPPNAQFLYLWDGPGTADPNLATNFVQASDLVTGTNAAYNEVFATITYTTA